MRVISGLYKGRKLESPQGIEIRPTLDRVKEAIFDVIQFRIAGKIALDLFAGSGAMGIEAASRGAEVVFNDSSHAAASLIRQNCLKAGFTPVIYTLDYSQLLKGFSQNNKTFDIIFIDPPYSGDMGINAVKKVLEYKLLNEDGLIVFEHSENLNTDFLKSNEGITVKNKKYGKVKVDFIYKID